MGTRAALLVALQLLVARGARSTKRGNVLISSIRGALRRGTGAGDLLAQDLASFSRSLNATPVGTWGQASVPGCSWTGVNCTASGWSLSLQGQGLGGAPGASGVRCTRKEALRRPARAGALSDSWTELASFATLTGERSTRCDMHTKIQC